MALKKQERKVALIEIYELLAKANDNTYTVEARKKVIDMLAADGLFVIEQENNEKCVRKFG